MYYIGFYKHDLNKMTLFSSKTRPTQHTHWYFGKVLGPYHDESEARATMSVLKRGYGYSENPVRQKNISARKALSMVKRLAEKAEVIYDVVQTNPGNYYHRQKFIKYMKELSRHKLGSCEFSVVLAKANEHLHSINVE